jgi:hypothetical protein
MRPDDAETTDELDVAVVGVVGARLDALTAAVTIAAPHREADEVVSQLATLTHAGPVRWDARATWREWIVGLTADPTGAVFAVTADGALRIVGDGRRYPLPVRAGLAAVTAIGPGELLACGAGSLVRIAIGPGRLAVEVTEDDGPGEALALAAGPGADGAIAVGTGGALWRCDGRDWEAFETEARESLVAAAWAGDRTAYAAGAEGGLYRWDGAALRRCARAERGLTGIAAWRGAIYVADGAAVSRLDGDVLTPCRALPVRHLAVAADHLFAHAGTLVARFDGASWWGGPIHVA